MTIRNILNLIMICINIIAICIDIYLIKELNESDRKLEEINKKLHEKNKKDKEMKAGTKIVIEVLKDGTKLYEVSNGNHTVSGQIVFGPLERQIQYAIKEVEEDGD